MPIEACATVCPDDSALSCLLAKSKTGHPKHLAFRYVPGRSAPEKIFWDDPGYLSPQEKQAQAKKVRQDVKDLAVEIRAELAAKRPIAEFHPGQRKKTRMGQLANLLANNVGVWFDGYRLATVEMGGSEGLKRIRELRDKHGWDIENRKVSGTTDQYRLVELPDYLKGAE